MKKNVLFIFNIMNQGGAELRTIDLVRRMKRYDYEFHFCVLSGKTGALDEEIKKLGANIHYINLDFKFPIKFVRMLREQNINIVHSNVLYFSGAILLLAKLANIRGRIAHFRSSGDGRKKSLINSIKKFIFQLLIYIFSTDILAVSKSTMNSAWPLKKYSKKKNKVIYNGFAAPNNLLTNTVREEYNISDNDILLLHIGRFNEAKNQMFLLKTFKKLIDGNDSFNYKLMFVGNYKTDYGKRCKDFIQENDMDTKNVIFTGVQSNVNKFYDAADIFLFPSNREGLPGSLIESQLNGTIGIASNIEANTEVKKYFPKSICVLELNADKWIKLIKSIIEKDKHRREIKYKVDETPFYMNNIVKEYHKLWSRY